MSTNLHPISHLFKLLQIIDQIYVFDTLTQGEPLNSRLQNFGLKARDVTVLYGAK